VEHETSIKNIFQLAWPAILTQATTLIISLTDLFFMGQIGTTAIAAVSLANIVYSTIFYFLDGIRSGTTVLTARYIGAHEKKEASQILFLSLVAALILGISVMLIAYPLSSITYTLIGDPSLKLLGVEYLYILLLSGPFILLFYAVTGFIRGLADTVTPLIITAIMGVVNIVLDYAFTLGKLNFPAMGVKGAAVASLIAYIVGGVVSVLTLFIHKKARSIVKFKININKKILSEYLQVSSEIGVYSGFYGLALCFMTYLFSRLGPQALAVNQITAQIFLILYLTPKGFSVAISIISGNLFGASRADLVKKATQNTLYLTMLFVYTIIGIVFVFAPYIVQIFTPKDLTVAALTIKAVRIVCIEQLVVVFYFIPVGALTGAKDTLFIMLEDLFAEYFLLIPLAYFLMIKMEYGIFGGFAAFFTRSIFNSLVLSWRFYFSKAWQKRAIVR